MTASSYDEVHFLREGVVDINAAVVGIGKTRWRCIEESNATEEQAKAIMLKQRFDILPISTGEEVKKYFCTDTWNDYSTISSRALTHKDVIPFQTHIRDVIKGFALESRNFYFLQSERRIVGLISVANLNCRQVKVYLFSLLSELEVGLGIFITENVSKERLLEISFSDNTKEKHMGTLERYEKDKSSGVDVPLVEYLYLSDLISIITTEHLYERLGYKGRCHFGKSLGSLNELRHAVAHPARSIINEKNTVERLWKRIDRIEEALFLLN